MRIPAWRRIPESKSESDLSVGIACLISVANLICIMYRYTYEVCLFDEARQKPNKGGSTFSLGCVDAKLGRNLV